MDNILTRIAQSKRREIEASKILVPMEVIQEYALLTDRPGRSMRKSVIYTPGGIISEFKRRSPSKGEIAPMAEVSEVIKFYTEAGAAACSVLTDTQYFGGSATDLTTARAVTQLPLLRKDFIIDPYQIYQARAIGADAILLIASLLSPEKIGRYTDLAHDLSLEVLLELHDESEIKSINNGVDLIGINNRDLANFNISLDSSFNLVRKLPSDKVKIAESGIKSSADMNRLKDAGFDGFLIGESLISTPRPGETLKRFINGNI